MNPNSSESSFSSPRATVEGFLVKRSITGLAANWRKRWFVLRGNTLYYYKSPGAAKARGFIVLTDSSTVKMKEQTVDSPMATTGNKGDDRLQRRNTLKASSTPPNCFKLRTPDKILYAQAPTRVAREHWVRVLQDTIDQLKRAAQYAEAAADSDGEAAKSLRLQ